MSRVAADRSVGRIERVAAVPVPVLLGLSVVLVAAAVLGVALGQRGPTPGRVGMTLAFAASFLPLSILVLRRVPGHPLGRLMIICGSSAAVAALAVCWSAELAAAWVSQWSWLVPIVLVPPMLVIFPTGRADRGGRVLLAAMLGCGAVAVLALAVAAGFAPRTLLTDVDHPPPAPAQVLVRVVLAGVALLVALTLVAGVRLGWRGRTADPLRRRQLACLIPAAVLVGLGLVLDTFDLPPGWIPAVVALPIGLTVAIVQFQLYDLDLYVHRGVVWLALTAGAVAVYVGTATLVGRWVAAGSVIPVVVSGAVVAAGLLPAERWLQRAVAQMLWGRRSDPYAVLVRTGRHSAVVADPLEVLPRLLATLTEQLRLPYAAVVLDGEADGDADGDALSVEHGRRPEDLVAFALTAHGRTIGRLLVGTRRPGERFGRAETRLLRELAGQAALAADAGRSALEIRRARDRLVFAREEERRRLRRDLHDGVASALVGARMLASAARRDLGPDTASAVLLDRLSQDLGSCTTEVRELIDELRPAALDAGLAAAIHRLAERVVVPPRTEVEVHGVLDDLPAAVEVVAFRVVAEALTNVVKHAAADRCTVRVERTHAELIILVTDDGAGMDDPDAEPGHRPRRGTGVGLDSMRVRVAEVGGRIMIDSTADGTMITVAIPVPPQNPRPSR